MEDRALRHRTIVVRVGAGAYLPSLRGGFFLALFETATAKMRFSAFRSFSGRTHARPARTLLFSCREFLMQMHSLSFDVSHALRGLVLISFMMLYRTGFIHCSTCLRSMRWCSRFVAGKPSSRRASSLRDRRDRLVFKAIVIPVALHRIVKQLGIHGHRVGRGYRPTMLAGWAGRSLHVLMLRSRRADPWRARISPSHCRRAARTLVMVTRRNAVSQVVDSCRLRMGCAGATGAKGMPLVVEISVAFSILIAFIVIGIFLFRIRERFDRWTCPRSTLPGERE